MNMLWLKDQMAARGLNQRELAEGIGMTEQMFSNVIAGRRLFKAQEWDAIRRTFGFVLPEDIPSTIAIVSKVAAGDHLCPLDDHAQGDGLYHIFGSYILS